MMRPSAFTLIELLITLGVIALLLGILLPGLSLVRQRADSVACQARLASIGTMFGLYAGDHQDRLPTFDYPVDLNYIADPIHIPEWGAGGGWIVLPITEITFWGYLLRDYAGGTTASVETVAQSISCPKVFKSSQGPGLDGGAGLPPDAMRIPQRSYAHSAALFTRAAPWSGEEIPDINAIHSVVKGSAVAHPASKANIVEAASHHDRRPTRLVNATDQAFNLLAVDGHVANRRASNSGTPVGFRGAPTGFESPRIEANEYAVTGIPFISTRYGHLGTDW